MSIIDPVWSGLKAVTAGRRTGVDRLLVVRGVVSYDEQHVLPGVVARVVCQTPTPPLDAWLDLRHFERLLWLESNVRRALADAVGLPEDSAEEARAVPVGRSRKGLRIDAASSPASDSGSLEQPQRGGGLVAGLSRWWSVGRMP
ncbi:unnamed protein product [Calypogeia fissa]